jgi:Flp pilus assembly protein TadG
MPSSQSPLAAQRSRNFVNNREAMAATEFALIFPLALILLAGLTEFGEAIAISRKVAITTRTVTDLVARKDASSPSTYVNDALNAASAVIAPYSASNLVVTVSGIRTDANGKATILWSKPSIKGAELQSVVLPTELAQPNIFLVLGQVQYKFAPVFGYKLTGPITLADQIYLSPRNSDSITP